ncbi:nuclear receptor subfamily 0 group B member 2a [Clarias gariepinus]|uniref:nuclear receptor subfamily 0 group B member 2a n=1 Tax=Clarias gariepinus TaxID=13013 RepID=UPI00234CBCE1|nr:nuclear receptor subfamily 0 group B member 2a [Clarias gariepinus]
MECECQSLDSCRAHAILFQILTGETRAPVPSPSPPTRCHCDTRRNVRLRSRDTCLAAASILVKTVRFVASLPAFQQLPGEDQCRLLQHCWAPLFILGLAQEHVSFEVEHEPVSSMLEKILLNHEHQEHQKHREHPTLGGVLNLKSCLRKLRSLDLSPKEYAYLKGTMIFNPDVPGLRVAPFVDGLQREAQRALREVLFLLHSGDGGSFGRVLLAVSSLQSVTSELITELFFRPIIGSAHLGHLITDMLFTR